MIPLAEVFAPVDSIMGPIVCGSSLLAFTGLLLVGRWASERAKRNDPTTEVSGKAFVDGMWDRDAAEQDVDPAALEAHVLDNAPLPIPAVRYIITRPAIGWDNHEGTKGEWIRLECEFGLRHDNPGPDARPVVDSIAWNGAVMGRIVRPRADPNAEVEPDPRRTNLTRDEARDRADLARLSPWATSGPDDLGLNVTPPPVLDDTIPTSPWDTARPGMGQIIPTQRVNGSGL